MEKYPPAIKKHTYAHHHLINATLIITSLAPISCHTERAP